MDDAHLQLVYRAVLIAKLTYASSSWWVSPLHLTDSVSKASYAVGAAVVYIQPTNLQ